MALELGDWEVLVDEDEDVDDVDEDSCYEGEGEDDSPPPMITVTWEDFIAWLERWRDRCVGVGCDHYNDNITEGGRDVLSTFFTEHTGRVYATSLGTDRSRKLAGPLMVHLDAPGCCTNGYVGIKTPRWIAVRSYAWPRPYDEDGALWCLTGADVLEEMPLILASLPPEVTHG